jgi:uncharacterized membrane protein
MSALDPDDAEIVGRRKSPREVLRESLVTGAAIILPLAVTLLVLSFVVNFLSNALSPISSTAVGSLPIQSELLIQAITVLVLIVVMFVVGFLAEYTTSGSSVGQQFDGFMESIPGIGSVYTSFNEMSELLLDSDTDSFQDVKLVQYPVEGSYTVAFKTADTPATLESDTGEDEMITLFMPMAPNPVMGGFVIHVSTDRVVDTDMTVEEGIRSIVTSGVAIGEGGPTMRGLSEEQLEELGRIRRVEEGSLPESTGSMDGTEDKQARYEENVSAEFSETPDKIEARRDSTSGDGSTPADIERGDGTVGETDGIPAEVRRERTDEPATEQPAQQGGDDGHDDRAGGGPADGDSSTGSDGTDTTDEPADDAEDGSSTDGDDTEELFPTDEAEWTEDGDGS